MANKNQTARLNQMGKRDMGWKKCPNCQARNAGYEMYHPKMMGCLYWCYECGFKVFEDGTTNLSK
jgi:hypothetical protein